MSFWLQIEIDNNSSADFAVNPRTGSLRAHDAVMLSCTYDPHGTTRRECQLHVHITSPKVLPPRAPTPGEASSGVSWSLMP